VTDDDWAEWSDHHCRVFGFKWPDELDMVASWREFLGAYSTAELKAATMELVKDPPKFREPHVSGLMRCLANKRAAMQKAYVAQAAATHEPASCSTCAGVGTVHVPHPQCVIDGEYVVGPGGYKAEAVVFCRCLIGERKLRTYAGERPMTLGEYEAEFGQGWAALLDESEAERNAARKLKTQAARVDKANGPMKRSSDEILAELNKRMNPSKN
jgi:hypothetical protein